MSAQRPGASGRVRKTDRGSGRSLLVRSAVTGRFVAVREKARTAEPVADLSAIPNGGLAAALERLNVLPPDACAWVHELAPMSADVPEVIGPRLKNDQKQGER